MRYFLSGFNGPDAFLSMEYTSKVVLSTEDTYLQELAEYLDVKLNNELFNSAISAYAYLASDSNEWKELIRSITRPRLVTGILEALLVYDKDAIIPGKYLAKERWLDNRILLLYLINALKFEQHPKLKDRLLDTRGNQLINIEYPSDNISDKINAVYRGYGRNYLGRALRAIRDGDRSMIGYNIGRDIVIYNNNKIIRDIKELEHHPLYNKLLIMLDLVIPTNYSYVEWYKEIDYLIPQTDILVSVYGQDSSELTTTQMDKLKRAYPMVYNDVSNGIDVPYILCLALIK